MKIHSLIVGRTGDLLRDAVYRRLWLSVLTSAFGTQIMLLALPLTAAVSLRATPVQMGRLVAMEIVPLVLFSLPTGVWLDRVRKLPVYLGGELALAAAATSVPVAWWAGWLSILWLYVVAFVIGTVNATSGSAAQIVLTQLVARERLIEANAKNALATSGAEVAGPGIAGALIKLLGAPVAMLVDAALLLVSAAILTGIRVEEAPRGRAASFGAELRCGLRFVSRTKLLVVLAGCVAGWQLCYNAGLVVTILFATRVLGLSARGVGLSYVCLGLGTILASTLGAQLSRRIGPARSLMLGFAVCSLAWTMLACTPAGPIGRAVFAAYLMLVGSGGVLIFVNFIGLRQAVTPSALLGRMTSTMRWLILLPAGPGALVGGWLGQRAGLRAALVFAALGGAALTLTAFRLRLLRQTRALPVLDAAAEMSALELAGL